MSKQTADVKEQTARFDETKDPARLEDAIRNLEHADVRPEPGQDRLEARREVMLVWLAVLDTLQRAKDPTFDPNDLPMINLSPPPGSSGVSYPAGINPKSIPEADVPCRIRSRARQEPAEDRQGPAPVAAAFSGRARPTGRGEFYQALLLTLQPRLHRIEGAGGKDPDYAGTEAAAPFARTTLILMVSYDGPPR